MKLAIMQPYLFPYIGYFQLIHAADLFVLYDDVNFRKQSWINRNKILLNGKDYTFTIPCRGVSSNKLINEVELDKTKDFALNFFKLIHHGYEKKAPFYEETLVVLKKIFNRPEQYTIADLNYSSIIHICEYLDIQTEIKVASEAAPKTKNLKGTNRIYSICKAYNALTYLNAQGGTELYNKTDFSKEGLKLHFIIPKTNELEYSQLNTTEFTPWLSIIDVLMNNSKAQCQKMLNSFSLS